METEVCSLVIDLVGMLRTDCPNKIRRALHVPALLCMFPMLLPVFSPGKEQQRLTLLAGHIYHKQASYAAAVAGSVFVLRPAPAGTSMWIRLFPDRTSQLLLPTKLACSGSSAIQAFMQYGSETTPANVLPPSRQMH